ncbi:unnamed protein product [Strongylus vulgaris]|uniref:Uncharacterized protein n=1 Tax=Strongylus vulgaris TaxID=40348 RepID=A0A3P7ICN0_STRVU|nr:unnamed protein product [Strongylus vulgaris]
MPRRQMTIAALRSHFKAQKAARHAYHLDVNTSKDVLWPKAKLTLSTGGRALDTGCSLEREGARQSEPL